MEPPSPHFSQASPAGKWLLSNFITHTWFLLIVFAETNNSAVVEKCIPVSTVLAPFMIQAFCDIPPVLSLLNKPPHSVLIISNPSEILCTLASLTPSAQHTTHWSLTHVREVSYKNSTIPSPSQINFQAIKHNMKNLSIHDSDVIPITSVLSSFSLLKHPSSVNKLPEDFFITFSDLSLIPNSSDLLCPAHPLNSATLLTFTEQRNCDLHFHTQITYTFNPVISGSFTSDTDFRDTESSDTDINHTTSDSDWMNKKYDSYDSFISFENENTTTLMPFNYTFTAVQIAEWARHHTDVSEMLHWNWYFLCNCDQCILNPIFNISSLMIPWKYQNLIYQTLQTHCCSTCSVIDELRMPSNLKNLTDCIHFWFKPWW